MIIESTTRVTMTCHGCRRADVPCVALGLQESDSGPRIYEIRMHTTLALCERCLARYRGLL